MPLNTWWSKDASQRFWLEITTRDDVGGDLLAPQLGSGNSTQWSYSLPSLVEVGDVVFHYSTAGADRGAIVGWSRVGAPARTIADMTWQARGTAGRGRGRPTTGPGWQVPLSSFRRLRPVISNRRLQDSLDALMEIRDELESKHGVPIYFPWFRYGGNQLRVQQGYLTKFPVELFDVLPDLKELVGPVDARHADPEDVDEDTAPAGSSARRGQLTRAQDPLLRAAIERRSLDVANDYYQRLGGTDLIELGKPYDIRVTVAGVDRHAEVKGSSLSLDTVELTRNEVAHAENYPTTDLIVVDRISWSRADDGSIATTGGRLRVWRDWRPRTADLEPRKFAYNLPRQES